jgi:hypothetical protein
MPRARDQTTTRAATVRRIAALQADAAFCEAVEAAHDLWLSRAAAVEVMRPLVPHRDALGGRLRVDLLAEAASDPMHVLGRLYDAMSTHAPPARLTSAPLTSADIKCMKGNFKRRLDRLLGRQQRGAVLAAFHCADLFECTADGVAPGGHPHAAVVGVPQTRWPLPFEQPGLLDGDAPMCDQCSAVLFDSEVLDMCRAANYRGPRMGQHCCKKGAIMLPTYSPPPVWLADAWTGHRGTEAGEDGMMRSVLHSHAVPINNAVSIAMQYFDRTSHGQGLYEPAVTVNGRVGTTLPSVSGQSSGAVMRGAQLYIYEGQVGGESARLNVIESQLAAVLKQDAGPTERRRVRELLNRVHDHMVHHHPFVRRYLMAGELLMNADPSTLGSMHLVVDGRQRPATALHRSTSARNAERQYQQALDRDGVALLTPDDPDPDQAYALMHRVGGGTMSIPLHHPQWDALPHCLLFPQGDDGWDNRMTYRNEYGVSCALTLMDYYRFRLQWRRGPPACDNYIMYAGRLFQEFVCKAYWRVEADRLQKIKNNPRMCVPLRRDTYNAVRTAASTGESRVGVRYKLPSGFMGGPRDYQQRYLDAMTIVFNTQMPSYMLTVTCNPNWPEIVSSLPPGTKASDRPDICCRVFRSRLASIMKDIETECVLGKPASVVYVVEFQKKGLPHAHILVSLRDDADRPKTADDLDRVISAEIPPLPDPNDHSPKAEAQRRLRKSVLRHHVHNDCKGGRAAGKTCPCLDKRTGRCRFRLDVVDFQSRTVINELENGKRQVLLRRRMGESAVTESGRCVDNRHISPYVPYFVLKYDCHFNVQPCIDVHAIKYLYKYVYKGPDRAAATCRSADQYVDDEISRWQDMRWFTSYEASWRLLGFLLSYASHSVTRLDVHRDGEQLCYWMGDSHEEAALRGQPTSSLLGWLQYIATHPRDVIMLRLRYHEFPQHYNWDKAKGCWKPYQRSHRYGRLGRVYPVSPRSGDTFYLRMYLLNLTGADVLPLVRTGGPNVASLRGSNASFEDACRAAGLLADDAEYHTAIREALQTDSDGAVRDLLVLILMFCMPEDATRLFEEHAVDMVASLRYKAERIGQFWNDAEARDCSLHLVRERLQLEYGASSEPALARLPDLHPQDQSHASQCLDAIHERPGELVFVPAEQQQYYDELYVYAPRIESPPPHPPSSLMFTSTLPVRPNVCMSLGYRSQSRTHTPSAGSGSIR